MRFVAMSVLLALVGLGARVQSQVEGGLQPNYTLPADQNEYNGRIERPRINPVDTTWVAFEVVNKSSRRLYVRNLVTKERREIVPPDQNGIEDEVGTTSNNFDLDWCPVGSSVSNWAVFASEGAGSHLFLYDLLQNKYYQIYDATDSVGIGSKYTPVWSPDGLVIAYVTTQNGDADIYVIRGVDKILNNPLDPKHGYLTERLVTGEGDQISPQWCPVEKAGYLAYIDVSTESAYFQLKVYDPRLGTNTGRQYGITAPESRMGYLAPSWSPDGQYLGYFKTSSIVARTAASLAVRGDKFQLGVAKVNQFPDDDSLIIDPLKGGIGQTKFDMIDVARNHTMMQGVAWFPDTTWLLASTFDEKKSGTLNPFGLISVQDWSEGNTRAVWLSPFNNASFDFPLDVQIVRRNVAFTFQQGQGRTLLVGQLQPCTSCSGTMHPLAISRARSGWYADWSRGRPGCGFFCRMGRILWRPVVGPDVYINKGFVVLGSAGYLGLARINHWWPFPPPPNPPNPRDWRLPGWPSARLANNFGIGIRF
jgi:hypothetical protein